MPLVRLLSTTGRFSWFLQSISRLMLANIFSKASSSGNKGLIRFLTEFLKTEFWFAKNVVVLDLIVREENSAITFMLSKSVFCHALWMVKKSFCWPLAFKIHSVNFTVFCNMKSAEFEIPNLIFNLLKKLQSHYRFNTIFKLILFFSPARDQIWPDKPLILIAWSA